MAVQHGRKLTVSIDGHELLNPAIHVEYGYSVLFGPYFSGVCLEGVMRADDFSTLSDVAQIYARQVGYEVRFTGRIHSNVAWIGDLAFVTIRVDRGALSSVQVNDVLETGS